MAWWLGDFPWMFLAFMILWMVGMAICRSMIKIGDYLFVKYLKE